VHNDYLPKYYSVKDVLGKEKGSVKLKMTDG